MSTAIDIMLLTFMLCVLLAGMIGGGCAFWSSLPGERRETLQRALMLVRGKEASSRKADRATTCWSMATCCIPVARDVAFLGTTMRVASRRSPAG